MSIDIASQMVDIAPQIVDTRVILTKGDQEHGKPIDPYQCPLARAINRHLAPQYYTAVFCSHYAIRRRDNFMEPHPMAFDLPPRARSIVSIIDSKSKTYTLQGTCKVKLPLPVHTLRRTPRILPLP